MAKRRARKSKQAKPDAAGVKPETGTAAPAETPAAGSVSKAKTGEARRTARSASNSGGSSGSWPTRPEQKRSGCAGWRRRAGAGSASRPLSTRSRRRLRPFRPKRPRLPSRTTKPATKPAASPRPKGKAVAAAADPKTAPAPPEPKVKTVAKSSPPKAAPAPATPAPATAGDQPVEAYCLREKKRVQMLDPKPVVTANGGAALSGTCPSCGAALYKLVSRTAR